MRHRRGSLIAGVRGSAVAVSLFFFICEALVAGSTGKVSGKVVDAKSREPLIGVNIILEGTVLGSATDLEGKYAILNVPPGTYTLKASSIGYNVVRVTNVKVQVDLTTSVDIELAETTIELGQEIVVMAQRPIVQKDLTSTSSKVSSDQIKSFPVEDVSGLVNLQAGVVDGHFRGGRGGEVLYMIDGIAVTDSYSGGAGVTTENHSIQELEVISGTFNAEYGQAMSGVVNQVTKDGGEKFAGEVSFYTGDYLTTRTDLFMGLDRISPADITNIQGSLSGPVFPGVTFFLSARHYYNDGHLYGKRIFVPADSSDFSSNDPSQWYVGASGDGKIVPLSPEERFTGHLKLTVQLFSSDRLRLTYMDQRRKWRDYDHPYRYDPDGTYRRFARGKLAGVGYTTVFSPSSYLELHGAWFSNFEESFVYEDPYDPRFPDYRRALAVSGPAFLTGGARDLHLHRESRYLTFKADFVSQVTNEHQVKLGFEGKKHRIWINNFGIQNDQSTNFQPRPVDFGRSEFAKTVIRPEQASAYVQDKMEFENLIVNAGIRLDYFRPKAKVLKDPLRLGETKTLRSIQPEYQISPRFGLAFPITDRGVLHLSYGHFFQVPNFDLLFLNPKFNINATQAFQVGNPALKSERTVAYELGVQQQLAEDIGIDVTTYYKDVRNLVGTEIFDIGNGNKYSQYVNRDYGNTRGFIVSLEKRHRGLLGFTIDYTFQIAKGNASDPNSVYLDNLTDPPRESQKQLAPLDWDRRHSLNASITLGDPSDYLVTIIGRLASGLPYTPAFQNQRTGLLNSENRPSTVNVDVYATKNLTLLGYDVNLFGKIYNLFDTLNELDVFSDTGSAGYSLEQNFSGQPRGINTLDEYYRRPDFYSAPRQVVLGLSITF